MTSPPIQPHVSCSSGSSNAGDVAPIVEVEPTSVVDISDDIVAQAIALMDHSYAVTPTHDVCDNGAGGPKVGYSRTRGLMGAGQCTSQKITVREHAIQAFDGSDLYYLRDPTPIFQGNMMSCRGSWSLLMDCQSKIQPMRNRMHLPGGALTLQIEDTELPKALWHITEQMMRNPKLQAHFSSAVPYIFDDRYNIINCIKNMKCYDSECREMIHFYMPEDGYYLARLYLEIYGMYVYRPENETDILVAKLSIKVGQAQLFMKLAKEKGANGGLLARTREDKCQFED